MGEVGELWVLSFYSLGLLSFSVVNRDKAVSIPTVSVIFVKKRTRLD